MLLLRAVEVELLLLVQMEEAMSVAMEEMAFLLL
jgi:hypothetical protein